MRVLAHFLGNSDSADAFYAAIKIPNFLQNLLGEGVLSASFIPVYSNLVAKGDKETAQNVASATLSWLGFLVTTLVLFGVLATPILIDLLAPGFQGEKRELTILLVQIIFPGTGLLVFSAWCLGILNSHHRFFLSYVAPVFSNVAVIAALVIFRHETLQQKLAVIAAWGLVAGSAIQVLVQLPNTLRLVPGLKLLFTTRLPAVRLVFRNFVPVVMGRGVVQLSGYVDSMIASLLPAGAVAAIGYAQTIYMLPISLFGMSISAAELPSMSQAFGDQNANLILKERINLALRRLAFFVIPSTVALVLLGDSIVGLLFETGHFGKSTTQYVWTVLIGYSLGVVPSTMGRLYSSAFYSLRDTRTPLQFSLLRVALASALGFIAGLFLPLWLGVDKSLGTLGLTAAAALAGAVEFWLLKRGITRRIGPTGLPTGLSLKIWFSALASAIPVFYLKRLMPEFHPALAGTLSCLLFGGGYLGLCWILKVPLFGRKPPTRPNTI